MHGGSSFGERVNAERSPDPEVSHDAAKAVRGGSDPPMSEGSYAREMPHHAERPPNAEPSAPGIRSKPGGKRDAARCAGRRKEDQPLRTSDSAPRQYKPDVKAGSDSFPHMRRYPGGTYVALTPRGDRAGPNAPQFGHVEMTGGAWASPHKIA